MERLRFDITVNAPAHRVHDLMLGLTDKASYGKWTVPFDPTSTYEGSWDKGARITFIAIDKDGNRCGMVSEIADHVPGRFVSIRHCGMLERDNVITSGPEVEGWAGALENYTFDERDGITTVTVELDTTEQHREYMGTTFPTALALLKELAEQTV